MAGVPLEFILKKLEELETMLKALNTRVELLEKEAEETD